VWFVSLIALIACPLAGRSFIRVRRSYSPHRHGSSCAITTRDKIVRKALSAPARQIAINAGEDGSIVVGKILEKDTYAFGYDAQSGEYGNLVSKGIIDPTKVVRIALQGAASIAGLLITTEAMVAELPKKQNPAMPPGGGMGGMGGMDF
jgi:chaperonin GroEL